MIETIITIIKYIDTLIEQHPELNSELIRLKELIVFGEDKHEQKS